MICELRSKGEQLKLSLMRRDYDPKRIRKYLKIENAPMKVKRKR